MGRTRFYFVLAILAVSGCRFYVPDDEAVVVMFYNVENLFDARDDGSEYPEYRLEAGWTEGDYRDRLSCLGRALTSARPRPDVLVLAEIENGRVLEDLVSDYLPDLALAYLGCVALPNAATGIGIASRYPIRSITTLMADAGGTPVLRPSVEARIALEDEDVVLIANHWKSKRGGAAATEFLRRSQAQIVASRLDTLFNSEPDTPVIVLGDFNERPDELAQINFEYPTALIPAGWVDRVLDGWDGDPASSIVAEEIAIGRAVGVVLAEDAATATRFESRYGDRCVPVLVNPWAESEFAGSYFYDGRWERIDAIYYSADLGDGVGLDAGDYCVLQLDGAVEADGTPRSWTSSGGGVSDHLPVVLQLTTRR